MNTKRISIVLATLFAIAISVAAFAQVRHPRGAEAGPEPQGGCNLASYLGLTADQSAQVDAIHESLSTTVEPLFDQKREAEEALHAALDAGSTDAAALGNKLLAIRALDQQIQAAHDAAKQKIEALLTADQKLKFEALQAARSCAGPTRMRTPGGPAD